MQKHFFNFTRFFIWKRNFVRVLLLKFWCKHLLKHGRPKCKHCSMYMKSFFFHNKNKIAEFPRLREIRWCACDFTFWCHLRKSAAESKLEKRKSNRILKSEVGADNSRDTRNHRSFPRDLTKLETYKKRGIWGWDGIRLSLITSLRRKGLHSIQRLPASARSIHWVISNWNHCTWLNGRNKIKKGF